MARNQARPDGAAPEASGPARLDRMLTEARSVTPWLRAGSSVPQQQIIRDFGRSRAKALKDIQERLPQRLRAGMPGMSRRTMPPVRGIAPGSRAPHQLPVPVRENGQVSDVRHVLVLPDRDAAEEVAEALHARFGVTEEPQLVRDALAGEDDAEDAQWLVVLADEDDALAAAELDAFAAEFEGWREDP